MISGYFDECEDLNLIYIIKKQNNKMLGSNFPFTEAAVDIMFHPRYINKSVNIKIYERTSIEKHWKEEIEIQVPFDDKFIVYGVKDFKTLKSALKRINKYQMIITKKALDNIFKAINEVE
jgi:hypothetical protein